MKRFFSNQKGFTLIELLVAIAILGILVAVATPSLLGVINSGQVGAANAELATVQTAVDAYTAENGALPTPGTSLDSYIRGGWAIIKEPYTLTADGSVRGSGAWGSSTVVEWDTTLNIWKKK